MGSHIAPPPLETKKHSAEEQEWPDQPALKEWQARSVACLRIAFGLVWSVAAWLKWQPAFQNAFVNQVTGARDGQPQAVQAWISWWGNLMSTNPLLFARLEASLETSLAVLLILGLLNNLTCIMGILLALTIWSTAEGFGAPYQPGKSTDVGTALPYALLFALLLVLSAGRYYGVDRWLTPRLGRLKFLASGAT
jgi:thiosulfate dehydrogenase (quinone) large subunit